MESEERHWTLSISESESLRSQGNMKVAVNALGKSWKALVVLNLLGNKIELKSLHY